MAFRDVTPVSLTAYWSDINYPVDQWLVTVESKEDATDHVEYPVYEYVSDYINVRLDYCIQLNLEGILTAELSRFSGFSQWR